MQQVDRSIPMSMSRLSIALRSIGINRTRGTLYSWTRDGMTGRDGQKVKMEYILIGGVRHSSIADYEEAVRKANATTKKFAKST